MPKHGLVVLALAIAFTTSCTEQPPPPAPLYLGEDPPGTVPVLFAPGEISTAENEGCIVFFDGGGKLVYNRFHEEAPVETLFAQLVDGAWTEPTPLPMSGEHYQGDFTLSPDESTLYITTRWPAEPGGEPATMGNIWKIEWTGDGWGTPEMLPEPVNTPDNHEAYPTVTADGTLYFFIRKARVGEETNYADLYVSEFQDGAYLPPEPLEMLNTDVHEFDPWVSPDGNYIIWGSTRPGGFGEHDLYISFRSDDGTWGEPVNMGEPINSEGAENRPFVTPDGRYFFFTTNKKVESEELNAIPEGRRPGNGSRDVWWVDAAVIEQLRPTP